MIKNLRFNGTNWIAGDVLKAEDLNDTFDATFFNPTFWTSNQIGLPTPSYTTDSLSSKSGLIYNDDQDEYSGTGAIVAIQNLASDYLYTYDKFSGCFRYIIYGLIDECNDSSIDGAVWTKVTSTGRTEVYSENAVKLTFSNVSDNGTPKTAVCDLRCSTDFYNTNKTCILRTTISANAGDDGSAHYANARLRITDTGGNYVDIEADDKTSGTGGTLSSSVTGIFTLRFSGTTGVYAWKDGTALNGGAIFSLAALTGNVWKIDFFTDAGITTYDSGDYANGTINVWYVRTVPSSIISSTPVQSFSSDGTNYMTATSNLGICTSLGNDTKMKLAGTINAAEVLVLCSGTAVLGSSYAGVY